MHASRWRRRWTLTAAPVRRVLFGRTVTMLGFNGQYPGPLIQVDEGSTITVRFVNRTAFPTAVHWHGVRLDNRYDGAPHVTQDPVPPGGAFEYRVHFRDAGIYWYHPHHREDVLQDLGPLRQSARAIARARLLRAGKPRRGPDARRSARRRRRTGRTWPRGADARVDGPLRQRAAGERRTEVDLDRAPRRSASGSFSPTCRAPASSICRSRGRARA